MEVHHAVDRCVRQGTGRIHRLCGGVAWRNTQGDTLEEARENLQEAVALVLEANRELAEKSLVGQR
jgi:hypothetical protein